MAGISKKIYKTKKGVVTKYTITYTDIFGKQHTSGLYDKKADAKRDLAKFEKVDFDKKNITYGTIFNLFLQRAQKKYAENTYKDYLRYYQTYFKKTENFKYEKAQSVVWQGFFDDIETGTSPYVAKICLKFAKAAVNYAMTHGLVETNIFNKIEKIKLPKADINHLSIRELKMVLETCKKAFPKYFLLLYTFIGSGAREGEVFAFTKKDFDYKNKSLTVNKQFTKGKLVLKPKTATSNRTIYLFDELADLLNIQVQNLKNDADLIFPNNSGRHINANNLRNRFWYPLLKLCKIEKRVRLHDLRGSYIDMILSSGLSIKFAQNQAGHSRSETTLNIYARNNEDMIKNAQNTLNNLLGKTENNLRINENPPNKKIIQFPKKQAGTGF